jgi:NAD(P)-dependent dehydrogenase (short-subunit alcohol dehydrogenase family)
LTDRVSLVTGANRGIGFEIARGLAKKGGTVVLLCRDGAKAEAARRAIAEEARDANVEILLCDLSLQVDVRRAAADFVARHDRLHVLVNSAGIFRRGREITDEGIERVWATNYLSHFLLTHLLLDTLRASAPARIVNVATRTSGLRINLDDLSLEKGYSFAASMGRTKLALILFTLELAERLRGTGVTVNAMHPGLTNTALLDDLPWPLRVLAGLFAWSPEQAARTALHLATSPEVEGVSGKLFADSKEVAIGGQALEPGLKERLWLESVRSTGVTVG